MGRSAEASIQADWLSRAREDSRRAPCSPSRREAGRAEAGRRVGAPLSSEAHPDAVARFGLLASAIARRPLQVRPGEPDEPPWTDGKVVFVDVNQGARAQLEALVVQASLLAAGSLDRDIVQRLGRREKLAKRYLTVEGHRALSTVEPLLPPSLRPLLGA